MLDIAVDETSGNKKSRRAYETIGVNIEQNHKKKKKKKPIGTDFMALNHPLRTNHEAQVNISKSFEKDILCMVGVAKVQAYWKFHLMWIEWDSNLVSSDDCT